MESIKNNKTIIAIGAGVASILGLGAYLLLKDKQECENDANSVGSGENVDVSVSKMNKALSSNSEAYQYKLQEALVKITVGKDYQNPSCIDLQTIAKILEMSVELASEDFVALTINQRKERRALSGEQYEQLVIQQCEEVETMHNKFQEDIIAGLGIGQQQFEESLMLIMQRGLHQQLMYLDMTAKQQLKMKLHSDKELNIEQAKEIIAYQNEVIDKEPEYFSRIIQLLIVNPEMQQRLPQIINTLLCDKVHSKYDIEEEDIVKMLGPNAQMDPEIQQLMAKAEEGMRKLITSIIPMGMGGMM